MVRLIPTAGCLKRSFAVGVVVAGLASAAQAGPVNIISSTRTVDASVHVSGRPEVRQTPTSTTPGTFNETALAEDTGDGFSARASASVNSELGQNGFFFDGSLSYDTQDTRPTPDDGTPVGNAQVSFAFGVEFTIDEPYNFDFRGGFSNNVEEGSTPAAEGDFRLTGSEDDGSGVSPIFPDASGVLQPGTYELALQESVVNTFIGATRSRFSLDYEFALELSPVDAGGGNGGGEPNPIPLPPAVWSGLALLGVGAARQMWKHGLK